MSESHQKALRALDMYREGMSWEVIGGILGWSPRTAQSMASRVKRWEYHRSVKALHGKRTYLSCRGRGKNLVGTDWTAEMEDALKSLWPIQTGDRIARILSLQFNVRLTRNAVIAKARRLKLPPKTKWQSRGTPYGTDTRERAPFA